MLETYRELSNGQVWGLFGIVGVISISAGVTLTNIYAPAPPPEPAMTPVDRIVKRCLDNSSMADTDFCEEIARNASFGAMSSREVDIRFPQGWDDIED